MGSARAVGAAVLALAVGGSAAAEPPGSAVGPIPRDPPGAAVELIPPERIGWSLTNLFAPLTGWLHGGPGYWYDARRVEIETTPPGALLDLFYVRRNFQKGFEQAESPVTVVLPSRIEAGPRDTLVVRAMLDGYRYEEAKLAIRSRETRISLELAPVRNSLVAFSSVDVAGRATLEFLTSEAIVPRMQSGSAGPSLILPQTAARPDALATLADVHGPRVAALRAQQLGEDLVVRVVLGPEASGDAWELRSRQAADPVRGVHVFALDVVPPDAGAAAVERVRSALARIRPEDLAGCAVVFDAALRSALDPEQLSRALSPRGAFTDAPLRAALRRLGELSPGGEIALADGSRYRASVPLELAAAASEPAQAQGYLALLRRLVALLEEPGHRREALRGLVAPELPPPAFAAALEAAESRERDCRG